MSLNKNAKKGIEENASLKTAKINQERISISQN
jgi:hypothetical protein